jgi:hypothetical protein
MVWYVRSKQPVDRFARDVAQANERLPKEQRFGRGSTSPTTMAKHIRRQIKKMEADKAYRADIEEFVEDFPDANIF